MYLGCWNESFSSGHSGEVLVRSIGRFSVLADTSAKWYGDFECSIDSTALNYFESSEMYVHVFHDFDSTVCGLRTNAFPNACQCGSGPMYFGCWNELFSRGRSGEVAVGTRFGRYSMLV